jgi:DNA-binding NarL/FixJ family response regulator
MIESMSGAFSVAVIAQQRLFLEALCSVLSREADLHVVVCASNGRHGAMAVRAATPDVVVVDLAMARMSGIALVRQLLRDEPERRILAIGDLAEKPNPSDVLEAGACGYACKDQPAAEVIEAVRQVARGLPYLAPQAADSVLPTRGSMARRPLDRLTAREREIFDLTVAGRSSRDVGAALAISPRTVETHRARILRKLEAHSAVDLVRLAAEWGLLSSESAA